MPTEEQILRILNTVARKYSRRSKGRFEVDELVNEVWLMGAVHEMSDIRLVWGRAKYDMIEYMRTYTKWRYRGVWRNKIVRNEAILKNNKKTVIFPNNNLEEREQIDFLCEGLLRREKLLLKLLSEGYTQKEVAKVLGYTQGWVSQQVHGSGTTDFNAQKQLVAQYILQKSE